MQFLDSQGQQHWMIYSMQRQNYVRTIIIMVKYNNI